MHAVSTNKATSECWQFEYFDSALGQHTLASSLCAAILEVYNQLKRMNECMNNFAVIEIMLLCGQAAYH